MRRMDPANTPAARSNFCNQKEENKIQIYIRKRCFFLPKIAKITKILLSKILVWPVFLPNDEGSNMALLQPFPDIHLFSWWQNILLIHSNFKFTAATATMLIGNGKTPIMFSFMFQVQKDKKVYHALALLPKSQKTE